MPTPAPPPKLPAREPPPPTEPGPTVTPASQAKNKGLRATTPREEDRARYTRTTGRDLG